jgi:hypothetical protein
MSIDVDVIAGSGTRATKLIAVEVKSKPALKRRLQQCGRGAIIVTTKYSDVIPCLPFEALRSKSFSIILVNVKQEVDSQLTAVFKAVLSARNTRLLPRDELTEALSSKNRANLIVAGLIARDIDAMIFFRGDLKTVLVPLTWFESKGFIVDDIFMTLKICDFGQTITVGNKQIATDALLYEFDSDFRRRDKRNRIKSDSSFGGALRRLRLQKNLTRRQFPGVSEKEIARIEQGKIRQPHQTTLSLIAKRLRVTPSEISEY